MIHLLDPGIGSTFPIADVVSAEDFPRVGNVFSFTVASWSMFPTIQKGDVLVMEPPDQVRVGDVVVVPLIGALVCHRVKGFGGGDEVYTQGDSADAPDQPIRRHDLLGTVTTIARGRRRFAPAPIPLPSLAGLLRMRTDLFLTRVRERLASWALRGIALLKERPVIRNWASFMLNKRVRFYLGIRAPVRSVPAYRFGIIPGLTLEDCSVEALPKECKVTDDLIFLARLGRHALGTFHPASGELRLRRAATGLGLEEYFRVLKQNIAAARATSAISTE